MSYKQNDTFVAPAPTKVFRISSVLKYTELCIERASDGVIHVKAVLPVRTETLMHPRQLRSHQFRTLR